MVNLDRSKSSSVVVFPEEVLVYVLRYSDLKSICRTARVCKAFAKLQNNDFWTFIRMDRLMSDCFLFSGAAAGGSSLEVVKDSVLGEVMLRRLFAPKPKRI